MTRHESTEGIEMIVRAARAAPVLSAEQEQRLGRLSRDGDDEAFELLVRSHMRFVLALAWESPRFGLSHEELVAEGLLGLVKAVRCFDPERGVRLATYAAWWIHAYQRRATTESRRLVRPPSGRASRKVLAGLRRTERMLELAEGRPPTADAVASALGVPVKDVEEMRAALGARYVPIGVELKGAALDLPSNDPSPETVAVELEERDAYDALLRRALAELPPRSRQIVEQRNLGDHPRTLGDLSRELGISRERVRQIETQAKKAIRSTIDPRRRGARTHTKVA